jgi:threonine dehydrogenase-like Zn-dependent dehydrogenase
LLTLSECNSAVKNFGVKAGERVLIYGAGPMGLAVALFSRLKGAGWVTVIDAAEHRLEKARRVAKVNQTVNFKTQSTAEVLKEAAVDLVIDAVGSTRILMEGSGMLRPGGKVCSLGVLKSDDRLLNIGALRHNTLLHMLNFPYGEYDIMPETADMIVKGQINAKDFYSHVLSFEEIHKAMEWVRSQEALKVVLTFD